MQITKTKDEKKPNMDCVNLLTSVLIYYPEISKISIEPDEKIYINYIIQKILTDEEIEKIKFNNLPSDWKCPKCGAPKSLFKKILNFAY